MNSYLYNNGPGTINIAGLDPNATFGLFVYTQGDVAASGRTLAVNVNSEGTYSTSPTDSTASTFILGQNYLDLAVTSDASGNLAITFNGAGDEADINGFQLIETGSATPEPGTFALAGIALAVVARAGRRRKR
jgi:hypothetical protein